MEIQRIDIIGDITQDFVNSIEIKSNKVHLYIDSPGGYVSAGISLYNKLRGYSVEYSSIIVNECSSIALIALLIAPPERRFGYINSYGVIHDVWLSINERNITAEELEDITEIALNERETLINIIAERTQQDKETIENLMLNDTRMNFETLKQYNFISNEYKHISNNNIKNKNNMKKNYIKNFAKLLMNSIDELEDEKEVIETKGIEDGVYETSGGDTITIKDGKVVFSDKDEETKNCTKIKNEVEYEEEDEKESVVEELKETIEQLKQEIEELKSKVKSDYEVTVQNRTTPKVETYSSSNVYDDMNKKLEKLQKNK